MRRRRVAELVARTSGGVEMRVRRFARFAGIVAIGAAAAVGAFATGAGATPAAPTLRVANHGVDSAACGAPGDPCRSITQAVANAPEGARILVGPGRYGDLNGDGAHQPGDERFPIRVEKRLEILSTAGATATILDGRLEVDDLVHVEAHGAIFGAPKRGFTLANALDAGLLAGGDGIAVRGCVASGNGWIGIGLYGRGGVLEDNLAVRNGGSAAEGYGFLVLSAESRIRRNAAVGNAQYGFLLQAQGLRVVGNAASGNGWDGFSGLADRLRFEANTANGNGGSGLALAGEAGGSRIERNTLVGNAWFGIELWGLAMRVRGNDLYGNRFCGAFAASPGHELRENFSGSAQDPGADPADTVCGPAAADVSVESPAPAKQGTKVRWPKL